MVSECVCEEVFYRDLNWKTELEEPLLMQMSTSALLKTGEGLRILQDDHIVSHRAGLSLSPSHWQHPVLIPAFVESSSL